MKAINSTLFGINLEPLFDWAVLAYKQVFFGREVGLFDAFSAPVRLWIEPSEAPIIVGGSNSGLQRIEPLEEQPPGGARESQNTFEAILLPDQSALIREIVVPEALEGYLEEAVSLELQNCSPFSADQTRGGWKLTSRNGGQLCVSIAISSAEAIETVRSAFPRAALDGEVWARAPGGYVELSGYGGGRRKTAYMKRLSRLIGWFLGALALCLILLSVPAWLAAIRANQYSEQFGEARADSAQASVLRDDLEIYRQAVETAKSVEQSRENYAVWLHLLSEVTPDSVFLNRAEFKGQTLSISGYALDAADYQSNLVESGFFLDLEATTAFTRNPNMGLEQFSFGLELGDAGRYRDPLLVGSEPSP